jgi:putative peptidoglycan lipid II flippase
MRLSLYLVGLAGANILLGFGYNWYLLTWLGPGRTTDALFGGTMLPQFLLAVVSGSLTNVLIPVLATEDARRFGGLTWTFFQAVLLFTGFVALLLAVTAQVWTPLTVPGFDGQTTQLAIRLLRIQLIATVFTSVSTVQRAAYNARHRFLWVEGSALVATAMGFVVLVWWLPIGGVDAAAWAGVAKAALQFVFLLPGMGAFQLPDWRRPELRRAWERWKPLVLGSLYYKSEGVVDRFFASLAPPGVLSLYHLALQAYSSAQLVLAKAIAAPAIPRMARAAELGEWPSFRHIMRQRLGGLVGMALGGTVALILVGLPVLTAAFGHGRFGTAEIHQLWHLLLLLAGVWVGGSAGQIVAASFYAKGDTRTPVRIGAIGYTIAVLLKVPAFLRFGVGGVAAVASLQYLISATVQYRVLDRWLVAARSPAPTPAVVRGSPP